LENNIVDSKAWANFKIENGLDGGFSHLNDGSSQHIQRVSLAGKKCHVVHPNLAIENLSNARSKESILKGVDTKKQKYGQDYFQKIGSMKNMTDDYRKKLKDAQTGMKMINNGVKNTFVKFDDLERYLSEGWKIGCIRNDGLDHSQLGTCWIHSIELQECKKIKKDDLEMFLEHGWIKGRKMKF
jgi:hypothetical protein